MKMMNKVRKCIILSLAFVFAAIGVLAPMTVKAQDKKASISLDFEGISDIEFRLYQVAVPDGNDGFTLLGDFASYSVDLTNSQAASTLKMYVKRDGLEPIQTKKTDQDGKLTFEDLPVGEYLILADNFTKDYQDYQMNPILLSAPGVDPETNDFIWDVEVNAKYDSVPVTTEVSVQKVWNETDSSKRPASIVVQLTKDGAVEDEVTLDESNQWKYTWTDLEASSQWAVMEKEVPEGYEVIVSDQDTGNTFVIVNKQEETPPGTTEEKPPTTTEEQPPTTETPPGTTEEKPPTNKERLPQTGQLWWPVGIMLCGGMLCVIIGVSVGRKKD